ncbi:MAG: transporter substrate-binding domain-containing protein [Anaerolineae bacterium]
MRRFDLFFAVLVCFVLIFVVVIFVPASASALQQPAPTLVPPTLVPAVNSTVNDALLNESAVARIKRDGKVRVGLLYNSPPFGTLNVRGEVSGFDADLATAIVETWGLTFEPVQVTRQTAFDLLNSGTVDMLVASQIHRRDLDSQFEFSETYFHGTESVLLRQDDGAAALTDMANRRLGYVLGTPAAEAISLWQQRSGIGVTLQSFLTLDLAYSALLNSEIDGVVDNSVHLQRIIPEPGMGKILDEAIGPEPYAIVIRRQDISFRNLLNKTLQYLDSRGKIADLQKTYTPGISYNIGNIPGWDGLGDDPPKPDQFGDDVPFPPQYAVPRIQQAGLLRVAGVSELSSDAPESQRRLDMLNRMIVETMAAKWGVRVEYVQDTSASPADLVANGQADMAVDVPLDWSIVDKVDLTAPYLLHGDRVMAKKDDAYETFIDLRGRIVAVFGSEDGATDRVNALAASANAGVRVFVINQETDAANVILSDNNANVVFGDSLKLVPHVQANGDQLRLTRREPNPDPWYSRKYIGIAVPRNDIDFRLLVEYTLQEISRSGQLQALLAPVLLPEDIPPMDVWPGVSDYLGFKLG